MTSRGETILLRTYRADDEASFVALNTDASVRRHMDGAMTPQRAAAFFGESIVDDPTVWAVEDSSGYVGHCFLAPTDASSIREIGFLFVQRVWGRGYATEVASRLTSIAIASPDIERLVATADVDNPASLRVLQKVGFTRGPVLTEDGVDFYELSRDVSTLPRVLLEDVADVLGGYRGTIVVEGLPLGPAQVCDAEWGDLGDYYRGPQLTAIDVRLALDPIEVLVVESDEMSGLASATLYRYANGEFVWARGGPPDDFEERAWMTSLRRCSADGP